MYMDDTVIAGLLVVASTIAVGGYVLYYVIHDFRVKSRQQHKAH